MFTKVLDAHERENDSPRRALSSLIRLLLPIGHKLIHCASGGRPAVPHTTREPTVFDRDHRGVGQRQGSETKTMLFVDWR